MAGGAVPFELSGYMIGILRGEEVGFVTDETIGGGTGETHSDMTIDTGRDAMLTQQREACLVMIDRIRHAFERLPCGGVMTIIALQREAQHRVIRLRAAVIIRLMAALALQGESGILSPDVAGLTERLLMRAGKTKCGQIMIEFRRTPLLHVVADFAVPCKLSIHMIRECHSSIVGFMASPAVGGELSDARDMTRSARGGRMRASQGKRRGVVIEIPFPPAAPRIVTERAIAIESSRDMIRLFRGFEILPMAGETLGRCGDELMRLLVLMTGRAIRRGMRPHERKARKLVFRHLFVRRAPPRRRVTVGATDAKLPFMLVVMAGRAVGLEFRERYPRVAAGAGDRCVVASQRVSGEPMIEFNLRAKFLPRHGGVTVHAVHPERPMSVGGNRVRRLRGETQRQHRDRDNQYHPSHLTSGN